MEQYLEGSVTISLRDYEKIREDKRYAQKSWATLHQVREMLSNFINTINANHDISNEIREFNSLSQNAKVVNDKGKIIIKLIEDGNKETESSDK